MFLLANISWLEEGPFALYRWEALCKIGEFLVRHFSILFCFL